MYVNKIETLSLGKNKASENMKNIQMIDALAKNQNMSYLSLIHI